MRRELFMALAALAASAPYEITTAEQEAERRWRQRRNEMPGTIINEGDEVTASNTPTHYVGAATPQDVEAAARIREDRARRKAENFAKRQPRGASNGD